MADSMARSASDAGTRQRIIRNAEVRVIERAAKQRHGIVTARTQPGNMCVAVACHAHLPCLHYGEPVCGIVERTEAVGTVLPRRMNVLVAALAIRIHHQH